MAAKNKPNELYITRVYDAPVKMVWDAYTDPKLAANWWGPRGFTITTKSKDFRPGGQWVYTMHGPDGKDWPNIATYHEIEKYSRLVYDHGATETTPPLFRVTVEFSEAGKNKTKMDMTMTLATEEAAKETKKFIKNAGGDSTWDRLGEYLAKETQGKEKFVINRTFEVPLNVMYEMWSNPKHLSQWVPPTGMEMEFIRADLKPGGASFYVMTNENLKMYGKTNYIEMHKPDRIVYTQQFADENGNVSRHPMAPTWPETMLTTITLTEEGPNTTRVTIEWEPYGAATREEIETFIKGRSGMTQGWTGSLDKLENYVRTV